MARQHIIYKIYFSNKCVFIGWADSNLTNILRVLFFGTQDQQGMDITRVSKIEYAVLPSKADCFIYHTYLVNKLKLNALLLLKYICSKSDRQTTLKDE